MLFITKGITACLISWVNRKQRKKKMENRSILSIPWVQAMTRLNLTITSLIPFCPKICSTSFSGRTMGFFIWIKNLKKYSKFQTKFNIREKRANLTTKNQYVIVKKVHDLLIITFYVVAWIYRHLVVGVQAPLKRN